MTEQRKPEFILWPSDRPSSIRVHADRVAEYQGCLVLSQGGKVVAASTSQGLTVDVESLVSDLAPPPPPPSMVGEAVFMPSRYQCAWPLLAAWGFGLFVGLGLMARHAGYW